MVSMDIWQNGNRRYSLYGRYGVIDRQGEIKVALIYKESVSLNDELSRVIKNDKIGAVVIPLIYDSTYSFYEESYRLFMMICSITRQSHRCWKRWDIYAIAYTGFNLTE